MTGDEASAELAAIADQLDRLAEAAEKLAAAAQDIVSILRGKPAVGGVTEARGVHGEADGELFRPEGIAP